MTFIVNYTNELEESLVKAQKEIETLHQENAILKEMEVKFKQFGGNTGLLEELTCYICFEVVDKPMSLPCGHTCCELCLLQAIKAKKTNQCPQCRTKFAGWPKGVNTMVANLVDKFLAVTLNSDELAERRQNLMAEIPKFNELKIRNENKLKNEVSYTLLTKENGIFEMHNNEQGRAMEGYEIGSLIFKLSKIVNHFLNQQLYDPLDLRAAIIEAAESDEDPDLMTLNQVFNNPVNEE